MSWSHSTEPMSADIEEHYISDDPEDGEEDIVPERRQTKRKHRELSKDEVDETEDLDPEIYAQPGET